MYRILFFFKILCIFFRVQCLAFFNETYYRNRVQATVIANVYCIIFNAFLDNLYCQIKKSIEIITSKCGINEGYAPINIGIMKLRAIPFERDINPNRIPFRSNFRFLIKSRKLQTTIVALINAGI